MFSTHKDEVFRICETPVNNHGCRGFSLDIRIEDKCTGIVMAGHSCSSCWQVGHDSGESMYPIGTLVKLPEILDELWWKPDTPVFTPGLNIKVREFFTVQVWWRTFGPGWALAALEVGHSHNESVDDWDDPQPDCTLIRPSDLEMVREILK